LNLIYQLNDYLRRIEVDYAICGGSAIDLFIGRKTRLHKDLDVAVFWEDRDKIVQYMLNDGRNLYEPCGSGYLHKINSIKEQKRVKSNIWCIRHNNPHYKFVEYEKDMFEVDFDGSEQTKLNFIEYLFNSRDREHFIYARNHNIKREISKAIMKTGDILYLAPELVLLYKSTALYNPDYQHDFENTLPFMNENQKLWLKNALVIMFPDGHEWIDKIDIINKCLFY
jgi:hypothetical protein